MTFFAHMEKILKNTDDETEILIPVREINDVPVTCFLEVNLKDQTTRITIYYKCGGITESAEILYSEAIEPRSGTFVTESGEINFPEELDEKMKEIESLKFDHFNGKLKTEPIQCENVSDFECVICYRDTKITTICGHSVCHECWSKLTPSCMTCKTGRKCPSCRNERIEHYTMFCDECN